MADGSNLNLGAATDKPDPARASDSEPKFAVPVELAWNNRGNICEASSRPLPVQYARLEDTPEFQGTKAAREFADQMISADLADASENGGWFGGDYYRPGGGIDHDEGRRQHRELLRKAAEARAGQIPSQQTAHSMPRRPL